MIAEGVTGQAHGSLRGRHFGRLIMALDRLDRPQLHRKHSRLSYQACDEKIGNWEQNGCRKESRAARTDRAAIWVLMNYQTVFAGSTFTAINRFIKEHNQEPKPFIWKADALRSTTE
ncbi:hypothetical protein GOL40_32345 [Sinorhizobium medicae]|nr:hypothetical protein [Sinorhizobium medicae]